MSQWGSTGTGDGYGFMYWETPITYDTALMGVVCEGYPQLWFSNHSLSFHGGFGQMSTTDKRIWSMALSYNPDTTQWSTNVATTFLLGVFKA